MTRPAEVFTISARVARKRRERAVRWSWGLRALVARERDGWREHVACRGREREFFGVNNQALVKARTICESCPVRLDCLAACFKAESATDARYWAGVFGGLSANERRDVYYAEFKAGAA